MVRVHEPILLHTEAFVPLALEVAIAGGCAGGQDLNDHIGRSLDVVFGDMCLAVVVHIQQIWLNDVGVAEHYVARRCEYGANGMGFEVGQQYMK